MPLLLAGIALAAPTPLELVEADVGRGAAAAVACSSSLDGGRRVTQVMALADALGADAATDAWTGAAALSERLAFTERPLHGVTWSGEQGFLLDVGSAGGVEQVVDAIAQATGANGAPSPIARNGEDWTVSPVDGPPLRVRSTGDGYRIEQGTIPGATGRGLPAELRAGIPSDPGCVLYTHGESTRTGEYHAMVHLPPQGTAAPVRVALTMTTLSALDAFGFEAGHVVEVRTVEAPVGVAVIGLGLDGLDADALLDTPEQRRTMRRLVRTFPWTAGTTVAVFAPTDAQSARVGAVLPLAKPWRAEKVLRRFLKVAGAAGAASSQVDGTHARVTLTQGRRKQTLHVAAREGQLLVASDPVLLATMEGGTGTAWVTGATAHAVTRYPIVLSGGTSPSDATPPWLVAVDFPPSALTAQIGLPLTFDQLRTGLTMFGGIFRANLDRVRGALPAGDAAPPATTP